MRRCAILQAAAIVVLTSGLAPAQDAGQRVLRKIKPSVVLIRDVEGSFGSGVVIDRSHVLTNLHVVNSALPFEVVAKVRRGGRLVEQTFEGAKVVGVHPTLDLALVEVTGASLIPAVLKAGATTGQRAFAVGNPVGPDDKPQRDKLTAGLVSSANRTIDGDPCIQTNVGVAPGNSGGALCDDRGAVIGIVTFRYRQRERLGFAIPVGTFKREQFVMPSKRPIDVEAARRLLEQAKRVHGMSRSRPNLRPIALLLYRQALAENPKDAGLHQTIGLLHMEFKRPDVAYHFFSNAVEMDPSLSMSFAKLGEIEVQRKNTDKAIPHFRRGLASTKDAHASLLCAEGYGQILMQRQRWAAAAYTCKWAQLLSKACRRSTKARVSYRTAVDKLARAEFLIVHGKSRIEDFGIRELDSLMLARPRQPPRPRAGPTVTPAAAAAAVAAVLKAAPQWGSQPSMTVHLGGQFVTARLSYFNCYLVVLLKGKGLGIFNMASAAFEGSIEPPEGCGAFAAAGRRLLVYLPKSKVFQVYDIKQRRKLDELPNRLHFTPRAMAMAALCEDRALVVGGTERGWHIAMLDLGSLAPLPMHLPTGARTGRWTTGAVSVDANMTTAMINGNVLRIGKDSAEWLHPRVSPRGGPAGMLISWDGRRTYSRDGVVTDRRLSILRGFGHSALYPVCGAGYFIQSPGPRGVILRDADTLAAVAKLEQPHWSYRSWMQDSFWASGAVGRIVTIQRGRRGNEMLVYRLDLPAGRRPVPPLVEAGATWTYRVPCPKAAKVTLDAGPEGMRLSPDGRSLTWPVPPRTAEGTHEALLNVVTQDGSESYRQVFVEVAKPPQRQER